MAPPTGLEIGARSQRRRGHLPSLRALLGTVTFLLTTLLFVVSDALARGGSGSHSFSGGGGGSSGSSGGHIHQHIFNNNPNGTGSSSGGSAAVVIVIVVLVIVGLSTFFIWRARRLRTAGN